MYHASIVMVCLVAIKRTANAQAASLMAGLREMNPLARGDEI